MSETERLLNDIRSYLRISAASASRAVAKSALDTFEKALIYSKLDGKTSQSKIELDTKVPQQTISSWLADFVQAGLASPPDKYNASHRALFTLQELGIELGMLKKRAKAPAPPQATGPATAPMRSDETQKDHIQKTLEAEKSGISN